jgi:uncharacterized protein YndB with AHSA1/START domain
MPTTRRSHTLMADLDDVWDVVSDPHHLPRWWPRVTRVEDVGGGRWTKVMTTEKGKVVRADERLLIAQRPHELRWTQDLEDSPFERLLSEVSTAVELEPEADGTRVTLELNQRLRGINRLGGFMVRRASRRLLDEALDGLGVACER